MLQIDCYSFNQQQKKSAGFTVIELVMGSMILAIIGTLCYGALWSTFKTQQTVDAKSDIQELGTAIINKVKLDISQTFHVEATRPITKFKGEDLGRLDKIDFTALVHIPTQDSSPESDQALVSYQTQNNPDNPETYLLQRREIPVISPQDDPDLAMADFVTISDQIIEFNLEYFDGFQYIPNWDIESPEQRNKLPQLIKITIALKDDRNLEHRFFNTVELPMWQNLSLSAASATPGQGGTQNNQNQNNNTPSSGQQEGTP